MVNEVATKYLKTQVETASPEQLVTMLYDGAIRFGDQAVEALEAGEVERFCERLGRCRAIVLELLASLNRAEGGEIAGNLAAIYGYVHTRLVEADIEKDSGRIGEALHILRELREGWIDGMKRLKESAIASGGVTPAGA